MHRLHWPWEHSGAAVSRSVDRSFEVTARTVENLRRERIHTGSAANHERTARNPVRGRNSTTAPAFESVSGGQPECWGHSSFTTVCMDQQSSSILQRQQASLISLEYGVCFSAVHTAHAASTHPQADGTATQRPRGISAMPVGGSVPAAIQIGASFSCTWCVTPQQDQ